MTHAHGSHWPEGLGGKPAVETQPDMSMAWLVVAVLLAVGCLPFLLLLSPDRPWAAPALGGVLIAALMAGAKSYGRVLAYVTPRLRRSVTAAARVVEVSPDRTSSGMTRSTVAFTDGAGQEQRRPMLTMTPVSFGEQLSVRHDPGDAHWAMPDNPFEVAFYRLAKPVFLLVTGVAVFVLAIALVLL